MWIIYRVAKKLAHFVLYTLTSSNIDRFSNLLHFQNQENICNNIVTLDRIKSYQSLRMGSGLYVNLKYEQKL